MGSIRSCRQARGALDSSAPGMRTGSCCCLRGAHRALLQRIAQLGQPGSAASRSAPAAGFDSALLQHLSRLPAARGRPLQVRLRLLEPRHLAKPLRRVRGRLLRAVADRVLLLGLPTRLLAILWASSSPLARGQDLVEIVGDLLRGRARLAHRLDVGGRAGRGLRLRPLSSPSPRCADARSRLDAARSASPLASARSRSANSRFI